MREIQKLEKHLLKSEYDTAKAIYEAARNQGYGPLQAAAIVYRHGFLDGKDIQKARVSEAYKKLYALKAEQEQNSPPEAIIEGSTDNE